MSIRTLSIKNDTVNALYNLILIVAAALAIPYYLLKMWLTGKYRKSLGKKFGFVSAGVFQSMKGSPRIWVHAVSVGEVTAAAPIVASLRAHCPEACLIVSTSTETGQEMARRLITAASAFIYYPLDLPFVIRKTIRNVRPDIFVMVETELWPNFIRICKESGIKVLMVNGRISPRSFKRYRATRFFWKSLLNDVDEAGVITETDSRRIQTMGMPSSRIHVLGNAKYDSLAANASAGLQDDIAKRLNMRPGDRILVAGSTHDGEETIVLEVYRRLLQAYPDFKLIIVPRHIERGPAALTLVKAAGFTDALTMTDIRSGRSRQDERVIVIDVIGELFRVYSLATVVYCGGSLVPRGGQNILEPAAWGKVIFYGPSMDDFLNEKELLEKAGAGIPVRNGEDLLAGIFRLLEAPEELRQRGDRGRDVVMTNMGASRRYADMIRLHVKS